MKILTSFCHRGLAIFKGTKLVGVLDENKILAHKILTGKLNYSGYSITDWENPEHVISIRVSQNKSPKINVLLSGDTPNVQCDITLKCQLISAGSNIDFHKKENKDKLKSELEKSIKSDIEEYLSEIIYNYQTDVVGFGRYAKKNFLTWDKFEKYNWLDNFKNAEYEIFVNTDLDVTRIISHTM